VEHVLCHQRDTGPVVGETLPEPHLASSGSRLSSTQQSTAWNSSTVSSAKTARAGCGGSREGLSLSSRMKLFTAALTRKATVPSRLAFSRSGTAAASGLRVPQTKWMSTDLPSLAISQGRPCRPAGGHRAALSSPRSADRHFGHLVHHGHDPGLTGKGSSGANDDVP